jgi:radical SAM protein with 4Fe4S-binding SPASM domain
MSLTNPQLCQFSSSNIRLVPEIRLRAEYFGGLVYDTRNGNTLEVDKGAFQLLNSIKARTVNVDDLVKFLDRHKIVKYSDKSLPATLEKLFEFNIIERCRQTPSHPALTDKSAGTSPWLSAPETVHWAVTYRCSENCPDCYARRFSFDNTELDNRDALNLIDKVADWGVFQLAIGGGEPFARRDLPEIVNHAANQGLTVHITTGKLHIEQRILESVSGSIKSLQIGIRPNDLLGPDAKGSLKGIRNLVSAARNLDISPGANLILTKSTVQKLPGIVERLVNSGLNRIVLLRYKPPASIDRWKAENPGSDQISQTHERIGRILRKNPQLNMRVDCSLSFIQRYLPESTARRVGIKGCVAADRILALAPDGSAFPCSQLIHPSYHVGNLLHMDPKQMWDQSKVLRRYRSFRTKKSFTHSWCGICMSKNTCGGCRVFAGDGLGGDPGCPAPLVPPLTRLGKIGRSLDLAEYLDKYGIISVAEYMNRYGVGQVRAIKELNASQSTVSTTGKSAKRKKDTYIISANEDPILAIQNDIGYTPAGFPYAPYEQIAEWIQDPLYLEGYPAWIKESG